MLENTIKKQLRKKIDSWLHSIKDAELKQELRDNIIVSGGCIVSMIQNQEPNDYDCYFKDINIVAKIANYYLKQFEKYYKENDEVIIKKINDEERVYIHITNKGILRNTYTKEDEEKKVRYKPLMITSNAISLSHDIQIITRFYGQPEVLHQNFDYIHTKAYYDYRNNKLVIPKTVYESVMNKRLIFTNSKYPICSLFRMRKFLDRGWNISAGEIVKMSLKISQLDLTDVNVLHDQLVGVDSLYFIKLLQEIEVKDIDIITEDYLMKLLDEVFPSINE